MENDRLPEPGNSPHEEDMGLDMEALTQDEIAAEARKLVANSIKAVEIDPRYAAELRERAQALLEWLSPEQQDIATRAGRRDARPKPRPRMRIILKNTEPGGVRGEQ